MSEPIISKETGRHEQQQHQLNYLNVAEVMDDDSVDDPKRRYLAKLSSKEILAITPMSFLEEATAVFLFTFGVPGAAYSVSPPLQVHPDTVVDIINTFPFLFY